MFMKKSLLSIIAVSSLSMYAASVDYMSSLVAAPGLHDTIVVRGPVIIGIVNDAGKKPLKNKAVSIYVDKRKVAVVPTNKYGVWSYTLNQAQYLQNSAHMVEACVALTSSNSVWTQAGIFTVNATRITQGTRSGNVNAANSAINFPSDSSYINTSTPTIVGTVVDSNFNPVAGESVQIKISGVIVATVTSNSDGVFSYQVANALSDGTYTVGAHCVQSNVDLATNSFVILTTAPAAPVILDPAQNATVANSTVIVDGTTEAYATITTFLDGDTFGDISYADENGNWSIEYDGLANGAHSVTAQATDLANNLGPVSAATNFTVSA
jgi:large repetitive protein